MTVSRKRKPKFPKVVPLRDVCAKDIAAQFRRMADELDSGDIANFESMVAVGEFNGDVQIFGWGNTDGMRAIGLLSLGAARLNRDILQQMDNES